MEKYSCYEYSIRNITDTESVGKKWDYVIYDPYYKPCAQSIIVESDEWYETEQQARFAAIGHIDKLENGES